MYNYVYKREGSHTIPRLSKYVANTLLLLLTIYTIYNNNNNRCNNSSQDCSDPHLKHKGEWFESSSFVQAKVI